MSHEVSPGFLRVPFEQECHRMSISLFLWPNAALTHHRNPDSDVYVPKLAFGSHNYHILLKSF